MVDLRDISLWIESAEKMVDRGVNRDMLRSLLEVGYTEGIAEALENNECSFSVPKISYIPKDNGKLRKLYISPELDRVIFRVLCKAIEKEYGLELNPRVFSYREGVSITTAIHTLVNENKGEWVGYKLDISSYFDNVSIDIIESTVDKLSLGNGVSEVIKQFYRTLDENGQYKGLCQGCALSALYSNWILNEIDVEISSVCNYYRYSDDIIIIGDNIDNTLELLSNRLSTLGLSINPSKTEKISSDTEFKYLGFNIQNGIISSTSKSRRTIRTLIEKYYSKKYKTFNMEKFITRFYGKYSLGKLILKTVNSREVIKELDLYIKDTIRRTITGKNNSYHNNRLYPNTKLESMGYRSMLNMYDLFSMDKNILEFAVTGTKPTIEPNGYNTVEDVKKSYIDFRSSYGKCDSSFPKSGIYDVSVEEYAYERRKETSLILEQTVANYRVGAELSKPFCKIDCNTDEKLYLIR